MSSPILWPLPDGLSTAASSPVADIRQEAPPADTLTPADRYQELFVAVQMGRVFSDSKSFVDCVPRQDPKSILEAYRKARLTPGFDLSTFVGKHFELPATLASLYVSLPGQSLLAHIDSLWSVLTRYPTEHPVRSSLLPLPHPYVVPGGRFTELYYWDSYFTMLGLAESGRKDLLRAMANNFAYLIDTYGLIPNGNRTYYLSRSQPPLFALMVELFESHGLAPALNYLPQLRKEYAYWMDGADELRPNEFRRHVVRLAGGELLNRYWDERDTPREEAYLEDVTVAKKSSRPVHDLYRDLRAAAASGWDFSSRWMDESNKLPTIRTTSILPVDLNSFLYKLECQLAQLSAAAGDSGAAQDFQGKAKARKLAMQRLMWNEEQGAFFDFDWQQDTLRSKLTAATATPLFVGLATAAQACRVANTIRTRLLEDGGVATTELVSGEQWDQPNGWAPLQWISLRGLANYGQATLAHDIAQRWLSTVASLYRRESKLVEKYALRHLGAEAMGGGGGEYPLQDGFGWTNGVTRKLLHEHPGHHACKTRASTKQA